MVGNWPEAGEGGGIHSRRYRFTVQSSAVTFIALLVLMQAPPQTSAPPLVSLEAPAPVQVMERTPDAPVVVLPLVDNALLFSPGSLFALYVSVEYEHRFTTQLTGFVSVGGGPFGQFGFDLGARLYPVDHAFESFFADARLAGFGMGNGMFMLGPMVELGYAWRIRKSFLVSVGAGAAMWVGLSRSTTGIGIFGSGVSDAAVFSLPGFFQPPTGQVALQPTFRLTIGPAF